MASAVGDTACYLQGDRTVIYTDVTRAQAQVILVGHVGLLDEQSVSIDSLQSSGRSG